MNVKNEAQHLRSSGMSIPDIAFQLKVPKSTVYGWVRTIKLSDSANEMLRNSKLAKLNIARQKSSATYLARRNSQMVENRKLARELINSKNKNDVICLAMLYWAEGGKDVESGIQFINSDPIMVKLFLKLLRSNFAIDESKFRVMLHAHSYHDVPNLVDYWVDVCAITQDKFYKPYTKANSGKQTKQGYMGCVSIRYYDKPLAQLLTMIYTTYAEMQT